MRSQKNFNPSLIIGEVYGGIGFIFSILGFTFLMKRDALVFDVDNPNASRIFIGVFLSLGFLMSVTGAIFLLKVRHRKKVQKRLLEIGYFIFAPVTEIRQDVTISVDDRHPYCVLCEAIHPFTGERLSFKSDDVMYLPNIHLGDQLRVYLDENKPKDYYVEITPGNEIYY